MWINLLEKSIFIKQLYKDRAPSLENIILKKLTLDYNGPSAFLELELEDLPDNPPIKWQRNFNRIHLILELIDIVEVKVLSWSNKNVGFIDFVKKDNAIQCSITGDCDAIILFKFLHVQSISEYLVDA